MKHILLVEDDADIRELVAMTLEYEGYQVTVASNGRQAIQMYEQVRPDLVISDMRMPEMTGIELSRFIQESSGQGRIPVVLLTAYSDDAQVEDAYHAGIWGLIIKPFTADELIHQMTTIIETGDKISFRSDDSLDAYAHQDDWVGRPAAVPDHTGELTEHYETDYVRPSHMTLPPMTTVVRTKPLEHDSSPLPAPSVDERNDYQYLAELSDYPDDDRTTAGEQTDLLDAEDSVE